MDANYAYDAGWQARLENKPLNELASKDWKDGYRDCEADEFPQLVEVGETEA
jgi:hypothetical protein